MKKFFAFALFFLGFCCLELFLRQQKEMRLLSHGEKYRNITTLLIPGNAEKFIVTHVVDGDTIEGYFEKSPQKTQNIRYLGIDTPEIAHRTSGSFQYGGKTAAHLNELLITQHDYEVFLAKDSKNTDAYDRLLRHVFLPDGTYLNSVILCAGYGKTYIQDITIPPYVKALQSCELLAKDSFAGIWSVTASE